MPDFTPLQLNDAFADALEEQTAYSDGESCMIQVRPPKQNDGLDASKDLLRAFHDFRETGAGLFGSKNASELSGFELWYDKQELQFNYFTETREREQHFRQQLDGHFPGCDIESKRERFVDVKPGEFVTGGEVWLENHYFEPIRNEEGVTEWDDPYLMLFSELDTRDDTRTMLQILFRPAEDGWTRTTFENVDDYAEHVRAEKTESKLFGLIKRTREATEDENEYAANITRQAGRPAFYVNIRYVVVGSTEDDALEKADNIATQLAIGYQEVTGQTLKTHPAKSESQVSDLIRKVAAREPVNMEGKRTLWSDFKRAKFGNPTQRMIMTIPEIAGLLHLPKSKNVSLDAIDWTDIPVEGSLPHNAKQFHRLDEKTRKQQLADWVRAQHNLETHLDLDERDMSLVGENPRDEELVKQILLDSDETEVEAAPDFHMDRSTENREESEPSEAETVAEEEGETTETDEEETAETETSVTNQ